jgi:hypothetical protein
MHLSIIEGSRIPPFRLMVKPYTRLLRPIRKLGEFLCPVEAASYGSGSSGTEDARATPSRRLIFRMIYSHCREAEI